MKEYNGRKIRLAFFLSIIAGMTLGIFLISVWAAFMLSGQMNVVAQEGFDHSLCQYPERLSNPPDGCDNSDPARPECMKYGTEDCDVPPPINVTPPPVPDETIPIVKACAE